ncbi:vegetative incompatibility protein HET-E-1 [Colletotrichum simmondsii]|uniref:Vegetative incompatibility protein HET-E-1 n=1 Tax=Colletotrichum simmondsii TaxID=703756 RepID=A0A135SHP0_9PEZI|nr:vegetative incompatibility protein HET-E-1 [Colletotrichum simmondsii]
MRSLASYNNSGSGAQNNNTGSGNQTNTNNSNFNEQNITIFQRSDRNFVINLQVNNPRDEKRRIERSRTALQQEYHRMVFKNDTFRQWRSQEDRSLLWVKGGAGKGKTMFTCDVIDELESSGAQPFYFFCHTTDPRLNTATAVLRGLLYMILCQSPHLATSLREKHVERWQPGRELFRFEDANCWDSLCKMIFDALRDKSLQNAVLIIDAIDECVFGFDLLMEFIARLSSACYRIVVSSGKWPITQSTAEASKNPICLELNE